MYNEHFGFKEVPFSIAPDPRYLYMSEQHREALAHLVYGFNSDGGFVLLTGEIGTGKTTVCRCLLEQIPENAAIAFILNPKLTVDELLATICDEFGINYPEGNKSIKIFIDLINRFLLNAFEAGQKSVLIIDEAQNLSADVLEQLRLLTNLETHQRKLLQIILLGQPELRDKLASPELHQLSQRIIARYHLNSLSRNDVSAYVAHRLSVAGTQSQLFPDSTIHTLHKLSGGVPRLINIIGDRALLGAYTQDKTRVSKSILKKAAHEVFGDTEDKSLKKAVAWVPLIIILAVFGAVLAKSYYSSNNKYDEDFINEPVEQIIGSGPTLTREASGPDKAYWPDTISHETSKDAAYTAIFEKWNIVYDPKEHGYACNYAKTSGLHCLSQRGNLRSLLLLNRPAVLQLIDEKGKDYYAAMTSFDGQIATLTIGSETINADVNNIESRWLGFSFILWRPPPDYQSSIHIRDEGPSVRWLDKQLSIIHERAFDGEGRSIFNDDLEAEVKRFQATEGLMPDGVAGAQTFIRLNDYIDDTVPHLTTAKEEQ